ncbi:MAG: tetratricopeptide repeat protein [Bacteroidetes bacterium]|nr:MAG: tetratricopeptide repeat protein [Bacteroidota bacterium]
MRKLTFLLLWVCLPTLACAQTRTDAWIRDSIALAKRFDDISRYNTKPDSIRYYAQEALRVAESMNYAHGKAMAHCYLGLAAEKIGYYPLAEAEYLKRLQIRQTQPEKNTMQLIWAYLDLANLYNDLGKEKEFMEMYKQVMKLTPKLPFHIHTYNLIDGMHQRAISFYSNKQQLEKQQEFHKERIKIALQYQKKALPPDVLPALYVENDRICQAKTYMYKQKKQDIRKVLDERMKNAPNLKVEAEGFAYRMIMSDAQATNNTAHIKKVYQYAQKRFMSIGQYEEYIRTSLKAYATLEDLLDKFQALEDIMALVQKHNLTAHAYRFPANYNAWLHIAIKSPTQEKEKAIVFLKKWQKKQNGISQKVWADEALSALGSK